MSMAIIAMNDSVYAQDESTNRLNLSLDVGSGFAWRGTTLNTTPVIQPSFTFTLGNFFIGTWTSTPFVVDRWHSSFQGLDVFIGYQLLPSLTIGLTDYFFDWSTSYFDYRRAVTGHALDLHLSYDGSGSFPIRAMASTIIAGNDVVLRDNIWRNNFSTYIELGYGNTFNGVDWEICVGGVLMESDFYGTERFSLINLGFGLSKSFEITPTYSLPLSLQFIVNPVAESVFLVATISLF